MSGFATSLSIADSRSSRIRPDDPAEPDRLLILGDDARGVQLEILAVQGVGGTLHVIHAMKMRRKYRSQYEEALPWRTIP
jgi:hypothetical protein